MTHIRLTLNLRSIADQAPIYLPLCADETVSSWADRHYGVDLVSDSDERDFGKLTIKLPGLPRALQQDLQVSAEPPDTWLLAPHERTLICTRCLAEDHVRGLPLYDRRAWCVAWRTCCLHHGTLFDMDRKGERPEWTQMLGSPRWSGQDLIIINTRRPRFQMVLNLGNDRRAIHLEKSLEGQCSSAWRPDGMDDANLRDIYRHIVTDLISEFNFRRDESGVGFPNVYFNCQKNINRYAINVLAEAIISSWTNTPLPAPTSDVRTHLLVRAIGWGENLPSSARSGQVLFEGPAIRTSTLTKYADHLSQTDYSRLIDRVELARTGYLTLPEARLIGLRCREAINWLRQRTIDGQFLAFDEKRGKLIENKFLPDRVRLAREDVPMGMILPAWAYRQLSRPSRAVVDLQMRMLFHPQPEDVSILRAVSRHFRRANSRCVRFTP